MNKLILIIIVCLSMSTISLGCTCYAIESFDLMRYDHSLNVVEVKIIKKLEDDYENRLLQFQKDTISRDKEYPPAPLPPPPSFTDFSIEVVEVFKGTVNKKVIRLRATEKNSSCYWEPEVGENYIFYFGEILGQKGSQIIEIRGCQRRIREDSDNYEVEVDALNILKGKAEDNFKINQSKLLDNPEKPFFALKGKFKNGERHGK